MWYHSSGNSLSVSTRHSHLGKLGSKCQGHPVMHIQLVSLPPMVISLSLKGVTNHVTCPQVQVFPLMRNYKYLLTNCILFPCNMKYETWTPLMHWPLIIKEAIPLQRCLKLFNHYISPTRDIHYGHFTPHVHTQNTSSPWHFQHQQHLISMSLSTSTSSNLNVISNININSS